MIFSSAWSVSHLNKMIFQIQEVGHWTFDSRLHLKKPDSEARIISCIEILAI